MSEVTPGKKKKNGRSFSLAPLEKATRQTVRIRMVRGHSDISYDVHYPTATLPLPTRSLPRLIFSSWGASVVLSHGGLFWDLVFFSAHSFFQPCCQFNKEREKMRISHDRPQPAAFRVPSLGEFFSPSFLPLRLSFLRRSRFKQKGREKESTWQPYRRRFSEE